MTESIWKNDSHKEASEDLHPLGRVGEPRDISRAVEFLLHPDSDFITGQILGVDGGMTNAQSKRSNLEVSRPAFNFGLFNNMRQ